MQLLEDYVQSGLRLALWITFSAMWDHRTEVRHKEIAAMEWREPDLATTERCVQETL